MQFGDTIVECNCEIWKWIYRIQYTEEILIYVPKIYVDILRRSKKEKIYKLPSIFRDMARRHAIFDDQAPEKDIFFDKPM